MHIFNNRVHDCWLQRVQVETSETLIGIIKDKKNNYYNFEENYF